MEREALLLLGGNLGERELNIRRAVERLGEVAGRVVACSSLYETEPWGFDSDLPFLNCALLLMTELTPHELLDCILKCEAELGRVRDVATEGQSPLVCAGQPSDEVSSLKSAEATISNENNFKSLQEEKNLTSVEKIEEKTGPNSEGKPDESSKTRAYKSRTIDIDIIFHDDEVVESPRLTIPHPLMAERRFVLEPLAEIAPDFIHPTLKKSVAQLLSECSDPLACNLFAPFSL